MSKSRLKVALIGECMIELQGQPLGEIRQAFGGDTLNSATYLARLLPGAAAQVEYVTALGDDSFSSAMLAQWHREGIGGNLVQRLPEALPGLYFIETDDSGERRFLYWRNDSAARRCFEGEGTDTLLAELSRFDWIYLSGISLAILSDPGRERLLELLSCVRAKGGKVAFDNNYRPALWPNRDSARHLYRQVLAHTDIALLTWEDEQALFDYDTEASLFDHYAQEWEQGEEQTRYARSREVVLKRGAEPCLIQIAGDFLSVAAEPVERVVDTTAAGDAFSAGYLACRLQGGGPRLAARWGHRLAAEVIQHPGAIIAREAMPDMPALSAWREALKRG